MPRYNIQFFDSDGKPHTYLGSNVETLKEAEKWKDAFNRRYRKPYPNRKGYYDGARIIELD